MRKIIEAPRASRDLDAIFLDGAERFGIAQAERFQRQIYATLHQLAEFPEMGRASSTTYPNALAFPCKIIYRYDDETLKVLRVYHGKQRKD